jgi:hypothetical protein
MHSVGILFSEYRRLIKMPTTRVQLPLKTNVPDLKPLAAPLSTLPFPVSARIPKRKCDGAKRYYQHENC